VGALLPNSGFVLEPEFDGRAGGAAEQRVFQQRTEIFSKSLLLCRVRLRVEGARLQSGQAELVQPLAHRALVHFYWSAPLGLDRMGDLD
jgi:hypothetical protein